MENLVKHQKFQNIMKMIVVNKPLQYTYLTK